MDNQIFKCLSELYSSTIKKVIDQNVNFYRSRKRIRWSFSDYDDVRIMGHYDSNRDVIFVNLPSVIKAIEENRPKDIEYYVLHEIRHAFQHEMIRDYLSGKDDLAVSKEIIEKWIFENAHYIKALNSEGKENVGYPLQDCELDAYAFAFAVMKYKYNCSKSDFYVPPSYGNEFDKIVDSFFQQFKKEGIAVK